MTEPWKRVERALDELAAPAERVKPDWGDVVERAARARRRTGLLVALGGAVAILCVSTAFAVVPGLLRSHALAFMRKVSLPETGAPAAVRRAFAAHRFAGEPRRAARLASPQGPLVLWVAPHRGGGWCEGLQRPRTVFDRRTVRCVWWKRESGPFGGGLVGPELFVGRAAVTRGRHLRALFEDGSSLAIPVNDGFYLYRVPERRLIRSAPLRALVLGEGGREVARFSIPNLYGERALFMGLTRRPGGADRARARQLFVVPTRVGPAALMVAPSKLTSATCWWLQIRRGTYGGGCVRNDRDLTSMWSVVPLRLRVRDHELWVLWGRAGSRFASLEVRFQDRRRLLLTRKRSFLLYVVPGAERRSGHRPAVLVSRDRNGEVLRKELLLTFAWAP